MNDLKGIFQQCYNIEIDLNAIIASVEYDDYIYKDYSIRTVKPKYRIYCDETNLMIDTYNLWIIGYFYFGVKDNSIMRLQIPQNIHSFEEEYMNSDEFQKNKLYKELLNTLIKIIDIFGYSFDIDSIDLFYDNSIKVFFNNNMFKITNNNFIKEIIKSDNNCLLLEEMKLINEDFNQQNYTKSKIIKLRQHKMYFTIYHPFRNSLKEIIEEEIINTKLITKTELQLRNIKCGDYGIEYMCTFLLDLNNLENLNLSTTGMEDLGLSYLCKCFECLPCLTDLNISNNFITNAGVKEFCYYCKYISKLDTLNLESIKILL